LREHLSCAPFYAKRAAKAKAAGDEMAYCLDLQGSSMTMEMPDRASSTKPLTGGLSQPEVRSLRQESNQASDWMTAQLEK